MVDAFVVAVTDGESDCFSLVTGGTGHPLILGDLPPAFTDVVDNLRAENPGYLYTICKLVPVEPTRAH